MNVLDLDIGVRTVPRGQENVDPRILAIANLAPLAVIAGQLRKVLRGNRLADQTVGMGSVDADQRAVRFDDLPRPGEFARLARRFGQVDRHARFGQSAHDAVDGSSTGI